MVITSIAAFALSSYFSPKLPPLVAPFETSGYTKLHTIWEPNSTSKKILPLGTALVNHTKLAGSPEPCPWSFPFSGGFNITFPMDADHPSNEELIPSDEEPGKGWIYLTFISGRETWVKKATVPFTLGPLNSDTIIRRNNR